MKKLSFEFVVKFSGEVPAFWEHHLLFQGSVSQFTNLLYTFAAFQGLYRILLEAESKGILEDVAMTKVEKLILDPDPETLPEGRPHYSGLAEVKKVGQ